MNEKEYQILIKSKLPKTFKIKKLFIAFFCGGLIGLFGQILVTIYTSFDQINYNEAVNLMMVTIIFLFAQVIAFNSNFPLISLKIPISIDSPKIFPSK